MRVFSCPRLAFALLASQTHLSSLSFCLSCFLPANSSAVRCPAISVPSRVASVASLHTRRTQLNRKRPREKRSFTARPLRLGPVLSEHPRFPSFRAPALAGLRMRVCGDGHLQSAGASRFSASGAPRRLLFFLVPQPCSAFFREQNDLCLVWEPNPLDRSRLPANRETAPHCQETLSQAVFRFHLHLASLFVVLSPQRPRLLPASAHGVSEFVRRL